MVAGWQRRLRLVLYLGGDIPPTTDPLRCTTCDYVFDIICGGWLLYILSKSKTVKMKMKMKMQKKEKNNEEEVTITNRSCCSHEPKNRSVLPEPNRKKRVTELNLRYCRSVQPREPNPNRNPKISIRSGSVLSVRLNIPGLDISMAHGRYLHLLISFVDLLDWLPIFFNNKRLVIIFKLVLQAAVYLLWQERNRRHHRSESRLGEVLLQQQICTMVRGCGKLTSLDTALRHQPQKQIWTPS